MQLQLRTSLWCTLQIASTDTKRESSFTLRSSYKIIIVIGPVGKPFNCYRINSSMYMLLTLSCQRVVGDIITYVPLEASLHITF